MERGCGGGIETDLGFAIRRPRERPSCLYRNTWYRNGRKEEALNLGAEGRFGRVQECMKQVLYELF
jgi:hypothetical protein